MNSNLFDSTSAAQAEKLGSLLPEWIAEIEREKLFQLFVPKRFGGLGLTLSQGLMVEEKLAKSDGSLGWTVTLCAGALWFVGFLDQKLIKEIFPNPKLCFAGSGHVGGRAEKTEKGYRISGHWNYASGALHATHLTANCEIWENGKQVMDSKGEPMVHAFILKKEEVKILDSWHYMGMIATGSYAFKCEDIDVPFQRAFQILPESATLKDSIFQYPFLQLAEATLAVNILGITLHLQELIRETFRKRNEKKHFSEKQLAYANKHFENTAVQLGEVKVALYGAVEKSWSELEREGVIKDNTLQEVSNASRALVQVARTCNASIYPLAGFEATKSDSELNRVWRDFNTVSQHSLLTFPF
ncbi:acyl-CoA dehydrogenase family protein [Algoriphagus algorifonticola]|uniref:acyl-CoA dehydrogenase n=1 Tax=Algoriphagus algorifonticola TaxID=2593007 RepID=UPI0011A3AA5E|nr:acyl-CoA dehydrogenase [Algoriphagus algorifonticola]